VDEEKKALTNDEAILRKPALRRMVSMSDATIWRMERQGKFPKRIPLGAKSVGWLRSEILAWIYHRANEREKVSRIIKEENIKSKGNPDESMGLDHSRRSLPFSPIKGKKEVLEWK